jgi:hypothetical protein
MGGDACVALVTCSRTNKPRSPVGAGEAWSMGGDACVALVTCSRTKKPRSPVGAGEAWSMGGDACVAQVGGLSHHHRTMSHASVPTTLLKRPYKIPTPES